MDFINGSEKILICARDGYENSSLADELEDEILDLLAEPPMRIPAHPYATAPE
ncbi:hypothetical protein [Achromobacter sp. UBA2119]|uniref:hypothetical protein n=1 Tax=Achromobacter sp. UBA2119 TaxID=1945911 RepID=UPI002579EF26|nr:hypothetical protein [Achromobacter sp. UBA2119]